MREKSPRIGSTRSPQVRSVALRQIYGVLLRVEVFHAICRRRREHQQSHAADAHQGRAGRFGRQRDRDRAVKPVMKFGFTGFPKRS